MEIRHTYSIIYLSYIQGLFIVYTSHILKVYSGKDTGHFPQCELGTPSHADDMSEEATSIFNGVLTNTPKLVGMEDSVFSCFQLQPIGEHFLKHPAQSVQKNNQAKQFGSVVLSHFIQFVCHMSQGPLAKQNVTFVTGPKDFTQTLIPEKPKISPKRSFLRLYHTNFCL
jgi:hypothetical protein